jgi:hypothetical protein
MLRIFHAIACHAAKPLLYCNKCGQPSTWADIGPLDTRGYATEDLPPMRPKASAITSTVLDANGAKVYPDTSRVGGYAETQIGKFGAPRTTARAGR